MIFAKFVEYDLSVFDVASTSRFVICVRQHSQSLECSFHKFCLYNLRSITAPHSGVRRKFSWGGFHSVAYGGHLYLVCAVWDVTIWRHIHVSKPTFWRSFL